MRRTVCVVGHFPAIVQCATDASLSPLGECNKLIAFTMSVLVGAVDGGDDDGNDNAVDGDVLCDTARHVIYVSSDMLLRNRCLLLLASVT